MTTPPSPLPQSFKVLLLEQMNDTFNAEDFKDLCFRLGVDYHNLAGAHKQGQLRELILEMERKGRLPDLLAYCTHLRPHVAWPSLPTSQPTPLEPTPSPVGQSQRNPRQIFLSHASQDGAFAQQLASDLRRHGWVVWMAPDSIYPGEKWVEAINRGLAESGIFVLVLTPEAVSSTWVHSETNVAVNFQHQGLMRLIPLELKRVNAPALWQNYQWIPFQTDYKMGLERLLQMLQPELVVQVAELYRQMQEAMNRRQWGRAQSFGSQITALYPAYRETEVFLTVAQQEETRQQALQAEADQLYPRLQTAVSVADWATTLTLASQIEALVPNYRDVRQLAEHARRGQRESQRRAASQWLRQIPVWGWVGGGGVLAVIALLLMRPWGETPANPTPTVAATQVAVVEVDEPTSTPSPSPTPQPTATWTPTITPTPRPTITPSPTPPPTATLDPNVPPPNAQLGDEWVRPKDGMVMVFVPDGTFTMGTEGYSDEPLREVTLEGFWIDKYEVTNAQYQLCVEDGACEVSALADNATYNGGNYPVVGISWYDAVAYAEWVGVELPTEEQWEYAARGEERRIYPWGDTFDGTLLNCGSTSCPNDGYEYTAPVGSYPAGASWVGALDMAGNVWEWTNSRYDNNTFVLRGGSWSNRQFNVRASGRDWFNPGIRNYSVGFRLVSPIFLSPER